MAVDWTYAIAWPASDGMTVPTPSGGSTQVVALAVCDGAALTDADGFDVVWDHIETGGGGISTRFYLLVREGGGTINLGFGGGHASAEAAAVAGAFTGSFEVLPPSEWTTVPQAPDYEYANPQDLANVGSDPIPAYVPTRALTVGIVASAYAGGGSPATLAVVGGDGDLDASTVGADVGDFYTGTTWGWDGSTNQIGLFALTNPTAGPALIEVNEASPAEYRWSFVVGEATPVGRWRIGIGFIPDTPVGDICPSLVYSGDELSDWAYQGFQTQLVAGEILAVDWNQKQVLRFEVTSSTTMSRSTVFDLGAGDTYLYHLTADASTVYSLVVDQSAPTTNTWELASLTLDGGSTYNTIASVVTKKSEGSISSWEPFAWAQPAAVPGDDDHLWVWQLESDGTNRRARMLGIDKTTGSTVHDVLFPYSLTNIVTDVASWAVTHDRIWIPRLGAGGTISQFDVTTQTWHEISPLGGTERIYGDQLLPDAGGASVKATLRTGTSDASRGLVRIAEDGTVTELDCEPEFDNSSSSTRNATAVTSAYGSWRWESGSLVSVLSTDGNWDSLYGWA